MSKRQTGRGLAQLLVLTGSLLLLCIPGQANDPIHSAAPQAQKRLLVIAPHPDDETLAATALIQQTLRAGGSVRIALMTNGDGFRRAAAERFKVPSAEASDLFRLGLVRQQEELAAIKKLGLKDQDILFLGYPDAGLHHLWNGHWSAQVPYTGLNGHDRVPYTRSYHQGSPYCGQAVTDDLRRVLTDYRPTHVLYPDPHDVHGDHWATSAFTQYALSGLPLTPVEWTYLIHYPQFPNPRSYRPAQALQQPGQLQDVGIHWRTVPLCEKALVRKRSALLAHRSQVEVMRDLLTSFVRKNDLIARSGIPQLTDGGPPAELLDPSGDHSGENRVDIRKLTVSRTADQLRLGIELARPVTAEHRFTIRLRLPQAKAGETSRLEVKLHHRKLNITTYPELNSRVELPIVWQTQKNQLLLSLPMTPFRNMSTLMIGTEVNQGSSVDHTAWRRLYL